MLILAEEWAFDGASGAPPDGAEITAEKINLALLDTRDDDQDLGAWLVQDYLVGSGKSGVTRKLLASTGAARHVLLHEVGVDEMERGSLVDALARDWSAQASNQPGYPAGAPVVARRIWPALA